MLTSYTFFYSNNFTPDNVPNISILSLFLLFVAQQCQTVCIINAILKCYLTISGNVRCSSTLSMVFSCSTLFTCLLNARLGNKQRAVSSLLNNFMLSLFVGRVHLNVLCRYNSLIVRKIRTKMIF